VLKNSPVSENAQNSENTKASKSEKIAYNASITHPHAILFSRILRERVFQQPQALSQLCAFLSPKSGVLSDIAMLRQSISQSGAGQRIASAPPLVRVKLNGVPTFLHSVYGRDFAWYAVELAGAMVPPRR